MELKDLQYEILLLNSKEEKYKKEISVFITPTRNNLMTFDEAVKSTMYVKGKPYGLLGDFNPKDIAKAKFWGHVKVYAKEPIEPGVYISTSYCQIRDFSDKDYGEKIYEKVVSLKDVVFLGCLEEGRYIGSVKHIFPIEVKQELKDVLVVKQLDAELGKVTLHDDIENQVKEIVNEYCWLDKKDYNDIIFKIKELKHDKEKEI